MSDFLERLRAHEELVQRLGGALRVARLYSSDHPRVATSAAAVLECVNQLLALQQSILIGFISGEVIGGDTPLPRASTMQADLVRQLQKAGVQRVLIEPGVTVEELRSFIQEVAKLTSILGHPKDAPPGDESDDVQVVSLPHIKAGRLIIDPSVGDWGSGGGTARKVYASSVSAAETVWDAAQAEGRPELGTARDTIENLAEAVTTNRSALVGLTAMQKYDNYTFTHMVNVSILTMAQARAVGMEGRLLRELGLAAFMHDIGKVKTPLEVLNKPDKLTDKEFVIMKRHVIDGAEMLRRTPEMPALAPVVAFEHHLRLDGTGYPDGAKRGSLNLATMMCSISDVYDAMRSQRKYQIAHSSERILVVLKRNDGQQFDQHLVRRFVALIGIYPPGSLVQLSTGEVAVVTRVHAPDPYRPAVRVVFDASGSRITWPDERNLWEGLAADSPAPTVVKPLEPADYQIDTLRYVN